MKRLTQLISNHADTFGACFLIASVTVAILLIMSSCSRRVDGISYQKVHSPRGWDYILKQDKQAWKGGKPVQHFAWEKADNVAGK